VRYIAAAAAAAAAAKLQSWEIGFLVHESVALRTAIPYVAGFRLNSTMKLEHAWRLNPLTIHVSLVSNFRKRWWSMCDNTALLASELQTILSLSGEIL